MIVDLETLAATLPRNATVVGLDLGTKTIGVAVSDLGLSFSTPRTVIRRVKFKQDALALKGILDKERCGAIVIGLPLNMDGSEGPRVQSTKAFIRNYAQFDERPVAFWDERLSTVAAQRSMISNDVSRAKRAERIDSAAAAFILQGALDRIASITAQARGD